MPKKKNYMANGYVKYTKADFLDYAIGFDYSKEELKEMKNYKLKDFHVHFGFAYKDNYNGGETLQKPPKSKMATDIWV